ncbi:MAG: MAPEG family protein [Caulobacteraceae bacterium]|nr:MAPEG family protein [Caulobacteraceae bacterium]
MTSHIGVALVTIVAMIVYLAMGVQVARARTKFGVEAPATTGHADFERVFRVQANTLEWLPPFLAGLWLFGLFLNEPIAAALGVVWIIGRILYMTGYSRAAGARSLGFMIQGLATIALLLGALVRLILLAFRLGV